MGKKAIPFDEIVGERGKMLVLRRGESELHVPASIATVELRDHGRVVVVPRWFYERIRACRKTRRRSPR